MKTTFILVKFNKTYLDFENFKYFKSKIEKNVFFDIF